MGSPTATDLDKFQDSLERIRTEIDNMKGIAKQFSVDIDDECQQIDNAVEDLEDIMEDDMSELVTESDDEDDD